jgi:tetratricopeptide (TPR) repeat protein
VLSRWLDAESAWRIDATDLAEVAAEDALAVGRWRRLRARIELGAARLRAAEVEYEVARAREVIIAYDEALRWDPDLAEAHIELAKWCALAGDPARALGHAEPFLAGRYPLLESNEALLTLAAEAHAALFARDAKRANFHDAAHYYERLLQVRGEDAALRLTVARHFVAGAERFRNVDLALEARRLVADLEPALPESAALVARLDALEPKRP